jgi:hypothetical protein
MELAIKEIENKIQEYKELIKKNKPLDYGEGVVEGLEEALEIVKKLTIPVVVGMLCECKEYDTLIYNEDMLLVCGNCKKPLLA